jgi:hypothetical protein
MKTLKRLFILLALIGFLFLGCSEKSQPIAPTEQAANRQAYTSLSKVSIINFTATDVYTDDITDPGKVKLAGLHRVIYKGLEGNDDLVSTEPLVNGTVHIILNSASDYNFNGPVHGKFTITLEDQSIGGYWEGNWAGSIKDFIGNWKMVALGKGGSINGMQFFATEEYDELSGMGTVTGYIQLH